MSPRIVFDPELIRSTAERLDVASTEIAARLDELDAEVATLRGGWSGEASEAYRRAHVEWNERLRNMRRILRDAVSAAERSSARYATAQAKVAERWS
jgi:WXG100 family type VII secretion target